GESFFRASSSPLSASEKPAVATLIVANAAPAATNEPGSSHAALANWVRPTHTEARAGTLLASAPSANPAAVPYFAISRSFSPGPPPPPPPRPLPSFGFVL